MKVTILKNIQHPRVGEFDKNTARIDYDAKRPTRRKNHQIIFQQGKYYGQVGDKCGDLSHSQLLDLKEGGFVRIERGGK